MKEVLSQISDHYSRSLEEHGQVAAGVGWGTAEKHAIRFDQLLKLVEQTDAPFTVNDLGCGYGALIDELESRGHAIETFTGYDISQPMIDAAHARFGARSNASFRTDPKLVTMADYSFASGIFNVRFSQDDNSWQTFILETLHNLNSYSNKGFAFNLLSSYVDWKAPDLHYADPCFYFDYCKRHFGGQVALLHDAPLYEWTMIVRKA